MLDIERTVLLEFGTHQRGNKETAQEEKNGHPKVAHHEHMPGRDMAQEYRHEADGAGGHYRRCAAPGALHGWLARQLALATQLRPRSQQIRSFSSKMAR